MNKIAVFCFCILFLSASQTQRFRSTPTLFVIWNVGQGLWTTWVQGDTCLHFDMGGEHSVLSQVRSLCGHRANRVYLSHWDWDHVNFVGKARAVLPLMCVALPPEGTSTPRKQKLLQGLAKCPPFSAEPALLNPSVTSAKLRSNELSHVLQMKDAVFPGDSVRSQEKFWARSLSLTQARWLVLGHHGSRTSTSEELLVHMPRLKGAIASARQSRYGHPHPEIVRRLKRYHIPLLRTEDWGNLWIQE